VPITLLVIGTFWLSKLLQSPLISRYVIKTKPIGLSIP